MSIKTVLSFADVSRSFLYLYCKLSGFAGPASSILEFAWVVIKIMVPFGSLF